MGRGLGNMLGEKPEEEVWEIGPGKELKKDAWTKDIRMENAVGEMFGERPGKDTCGSEHGPVGAREDIYGIQKKEGGRGGSGADAVHGLCRHRPPGGILHHCLHAEKRDSGHPAGGP